MNRNYLLLIVLLLLFSCKEEPKPNAVAQVFQEVLTKKEVYDQVDDNLSPDDSTIMAQSIIENWVKQKMLVEQANRNLPDSLKDFTKELELEKNNLLIFTYENAYVGEKLDTLVTQPEIEEYYIQNSKSFTLSDYILRFNFVKIASSAENFEKRTIKELLSSPEDKLEELKDYCSDIGATFSYSSDSTEWFYLKEFLDIIPVEVYNNETFLKKQKFIDFESQNFRYFVYIHEYKLKDEVAPLNVVEKKIKTLILNRRKQLILKELKADLFQKAVRENQIKYFDQ